MRNYKFSKKETQQQKNKKEKQENEYELTKPQLVCIAFRYKVLFLRLSQK